MRLLLVTVIALFLQRPALAPATAQTTSSIRVIVRVTGTDAPLPDADVTVNGPRGSASTLHRARTDAAGAAQVDNLPLGNYSVAAQREGYIYDIRGSREPVLLQPIASGVIPLSSSESQGIVFYFRPAGSISGRVLDSQRRPIVNARVALLVLTYLNGRPSLLEGRSATTDGEGLFSLKQVSDGNYYIRLQSAQYTFDAYYPGVSDADRATPIVIRNGENITGIELAAPNVPTFKVSGTLLNSPGPVPSFTFSPTRGPDIPNSDYPSLPNRFPDSTERFEISGVPSGSWNLFPIVPLENTAVDRVQVISRPNATGLARIDIVDHDIDGVVIVIGSATVEGHVNVKGNPTQVPLDPRQVRVSLIPQDHIPKILLAGTSLDQTPDDSGAFIFPNMPPGNYSVLVRPLLNWHVSDLRSGNKSIFDQSRITVGIDPVELLEIELSSAGGTIKGILDESTAARGDYTEPVIALVPLSQFQRENLLLYKTTTLTGGPGEFTFRNVAPGNYKVIAWKHTPPGNPSMNVDFVSRYESRGVSVSVKAGETSTVRVQLIPEGN